MAVDIVTHPDVTSGEIHEYGFHKVLTQTKTILINMLRDFFSSESILFKIDIPTLSTIQTPEDDKRKVLYIERDFPYGERKFPLVVVTLKPSKERKAYIGADDFLYLEKFESSTGETAFADFYAGMNDIDVQITIATETPDERMHICELINVCFTHYYRGHFLYEDSEHARFNIVPASNGLQISNESEIEGDDVTQIVYMNAVSFTCLVEYIFPSMWDRYTRIKHIDISNDVTMK